MAFDEGLAMTDTRACPECAGSGKVGISHGHDPYRGEIITIDVCPECDGAGEIEVAPIDQEDLP